MIAAQVAVEEALLLLKIGFLVLLYLFLWKIVRTASRDLRTPQESFVLAPQQVRKGASEKRAKGRLVVVADGDGKGRVFEIDTAAVTVGRGHANDIPLDDEFASTQHARLEARSDGVWLEDVGLDERHRRQRHAHRRAAQAHPRRRDPHRGHRLPLRTIMSVVRTASLTDPGRRRRHNEDAFVCEPPLFAIADGMGGAQAGELASRLAAAVVGRADADGRTGRELVVGLIEDANRSVYERASGDESVSGMGTTMTVALAEDDHVWIGHVGDSRAYLLRDGSLEQLTDDHSLVAELVRSGRLAPDEAGNHPHRSVITRALGTDAEVAVDVIAVQTKPGDVFVLCSDGLSSMVGDDAIRHVLEKHADDLDEAARVLVDAANAAGGEDNITVVLFEATGSAEALDETGEIAGLPPEETLHGVPSPFPREEAAPRQRRARVGPALIATGLAVIVLGALSVFGLSRAHFVGVEENGAVAVYQGLPWDLGFGLRLYRVVYESPLLAAHLSQDERRELFDHDLESRNSAIGEINAYARDVVP